ncbi:hypothetical protein [Alloactinosynnema sp. L-07]|nr:hypothetical protein [Alloactinosynnema sp. L-07]
MQLSLYRVGAWCWIVTGVGHLIGEVLLRLSPSPEGTAAHAAMGEHYFELMGTRRSIQQMMTGFGVAMGLAIALSGLLFLLVARVAADDKARPAGFVGLAVSAAMFTVAVTLLPPPPIVLFALASLAFAAALIVKPARTA